MTDVLDGEVDQARKLFAPDAGRGEGRRDSDLSLELRKPRYELIGATQPRSSIMATPTMLMRPMPQKKPAESTGTNWRQRFSPISLAK